MFDVGFWELLLIGLLGLVVLGPERLPRAAREVGLWVGRARRLAADFRDQMESELDAAELRRELQRERDELKRMQAQITETAQQARDSVQHTLDQARESVDGPRDKDDG